jgi:dTDP-4-dehydrorhamnose reductase
MRIAITGTTGRVGAALAQHLSHEHEIIALSRQQLDLADPAGIERALHSIDSLACDVWLHPAAITRLEDCEDDPELAMQVNASSPAHIASWCAASGVRMIQISTDYVFDGCSSSLLDESAAAFPIHAYGRSKLAGERAVLAHPQHLVLRVSWVFGPEKPSFVDGVFDAAIAGRPLAAIADKWSLPTHTADLASWVSRLLQTDAVGTVHACQSGEPASWHDMACCVVEEMAACGCLAAVPEVRELALDQMESFRAQRPRFTAMSNAWLSQYLGEAPRDWREALRDYVRVKCDRA